MNALKKVIEAQEEQIRFLQISVKTLADYNDKLEKKTKKLDEVSEVVQEFCRLREEDDDKFASAIIYQIKAILVGGEKP